MPVALKHFGKLVSKPIGVNNTFIGSHDLFESVFNKLLIVLNTVSTLGANLKRCKFEDFFKRAHHYCLLLTSIYLSLNNGYLV